MGNTVFKEIRPGKQLSLNLGALSSSCLADFKNELGDETLIDLPQVVTGMDLAKFREKVCQFLSAHESYRSLQRLHRNQPLTPSDLSELEHMLIDAGGTELINLAKEQSHQQFSLWPKVTRFQLSGSKRFDFSGT